MIVDIDMLQPCEIFLDTRRLQRVKKLRADGRKIDPIKIMPFEDRFGIADGAHRTRVAYDMNERAIEATVVELEPLYKDLFEDAYLRGKTHVKYLRPYHPFICSILYQWDDNRELKSKKY